MDKLKKTLASTGAGAVVTGTASLLLGGMGLAVGGTAIALTFPVAAAIGLVSSVASNSVGNDKK